MIKKTKTEESIVPELRTEIKALIQKKIPACFDREPASAFNSNLDLLVDEIVALCR